MLGWNDRKSSRYLDPEDLYDQLDSMRSYLGDLTRTVSKNTKSGASSAKSYVSHTADDAEELMRDNLAASMLLAVGVGVVVGYFLGRGGED
ncbi:hypothetical protein [Methyloligella solikamskensis]|uniref:DUF883 domain-containing protein n=1 Tax=Methyloligella solikamskensis TaxID=1177756 RepID=A0ABW3JD44_9HYPH